MDADRLLRDRAEHDRFLAGHYASPLPEEHRAGFGGLDHYPPDPEWVLTGGWEAAGGTAEIVSSDGAVSRYRVMGVVSLEVAGARYRLTVLDDGDGAPFLPFRDATSGVTTYAGGRYARVEIPGDGTATVDFNRASNPWCAFDTEFACPLPPPGNVVGAPVTAGEKTWHPPRAAAGGPGGDAPGQRG